MVRKRRDVEVVPRRVTVHHEKRLDPQHFRNRRNLDCSSWRDVDLNSFERCPASLIPQARSDAVFFAQNQFPLNPAIRAPTRDRLQTCECVVIVLLQVANHVIVIHGVSVLCMKCGGGASYKNCSWNLCLEFRRMSQQGLPIGDFALLSHGSLSWDGGLASAAEARPQMRGPSAREWWKLAARLAPASSIDQTCLREWLAQVRAMRKRFPA